MSKKLQSLTQKWRVIEYKNGCVYKTEPIGYCWADSGINRQDGDIIYGSISTSITKKLGDSKCYRWVDKDTPTIVDCELPSA